MNIPVARFRFSLSSVDSLHLPAYKGSTFRGGFGRAFKRVVCVTRNRICEECMLQKRCIYAYVFETPIPPEARVMRGYEKAPHPFILEPPLETKQLYTPDEELDFSLVLVGKVIDYLPYFIYTFQSLGSLGIGRGSGRFTLNKVRSLVDTAHDDAIYSSDTEVLRPFKWQALSIGKTLETPVAPPLITLRFITPTRIMYRGKLLFELDFQTLIINLLRRLALLAYFHCGGNPQEEIPFVDLIEKAGAVNVNDRSLKWYDWERYSNRQDTRMKLGGFVGTITFEGDLSPFMPYIQAGEILHVGKGTSFGLGKYKIELINKNSQDNDVL